MRHVIPMASLCCAFMMSAQWATAQQESEGKAEVLGLKWGSKNINFDIPVLETETHEVTVTGYTGIDDFFTVREANSNVRGGQWEFEINTVWSTFRSGIGRDDDFTLTPSLKYGITDDFNVEIGLMPIHMGDGTNFDGLHDRSEERFGDGTSRFGFRDDGPDNGNGDISLKAYWQMVREHGLVPAMALWGEARLPSGDGSAETDGTFHLNVTKTLHDGVRGHFQGYLKTANGSRGDMDRREIGDRRDFQWGAGVGLDFAVTANDMLLVNYMNRSSEYDGNANANSYELGWVHNIDDRNRLMLVGTYADTRGENESARWRTGLQWSISF